MAVFEGKSVGDKTVFPGTAVASDVPAKPDLRQPWEKSINAPARTEPTFAERVGTDVTEAGKAVGKAFTPPSSSQSGTDYTASSLTAVPKQFGALANLVAQLTGIPELQKTLISRPVSSALNTVGGLKNNPITPEDVDAAMLALRPGMGGSLKLPPISETPAIPALTPAQQAIKAGYRLHPAMTDSPGLVSDALAGWGGKIKTNQLASEKNQQVTNSLAAKALGLPPDAELNTTAFQKIRKTANQAYDRVQKAVPELAVDDGFRQKIAGLGGRNTRAAQEFPELLNNLEVQKLQRDLGGRQQISTEGAMQLVRQLRADSSANLRAFSDPGKRALGFAQREAAEAIDALIDRNVERLAFAGSDLEARISPTLVADYRAARQLIAKSYDVEEATNTATGDVSARSLAGAQARGRPLTDELKTIADVGTAFPRIVQDTARFGGTEKVSILDLAAAAARPDLLGLVLGRPIARQTLLSRPWQSRLSGAPKSTPIGGDPSQPSFLGPGILGAVSPSIPDSIVGGRRDQ